MKRRVEGWKAKSWYNVYAPDSFDRAYIGNTISGDPETVRGRVIQTTLGEITNDYGKQHIKMRFKVQDVAGDAGYTEFVGHEITKDYMRGLVKRRSSRIDTLILLTTKDGRKVRPTVTTLTINRADVSQAHAIRAAIAEFMKKKAAETEFETFVKEMVIGDIARDIFKEIKIIYPVRRVEIIKSKVEEGARTPRVAA
ncbi:MAG: 30S ribosomal protein S3ae [Methanomicrobiaceae archaeon]|nr:30S ribosomal protein S3ae [Methanomicrobiaceae archaeon]